MADKRKLDRDEVVAAALALTRREGLDGLTMRALAIELEVTTMATYHWVPSKQALVDLVLDELLLGMRQSAPTDWQGWLRSQARAYLEIVRTYPGVEAAFRDHSVTDVERTGIRQVRALLREAGFSEPTLTYAWDLYQSFMFGHFALEGQRGRSRAKDTAAFEWGLEKVLSAMAASL